MKTRILLLCLAMACLTGCFQSAVAPIDGYSWEMTTIQGNENGGVVACAPELLQQNEGAQGLVLRCHAQDGVLTLTDSTNGQGYSGTYRMEQAAPEATTYQIAIGDAAGYAVTGMTTFLDGSQSPTFIINIGGYALNFEAVAQGEDAPSA